MGVGIYGPPNDYDFGLDFDYSVWVPNTKVDLVNVSWNNDYRDVVKFTSRTTLDSYIDSLEPTGIRIEQLSYVKVNEPVRIQIPFNRAIKYNYLRASNPLQPVPFDERRNFYYFILDVKYVAPMTTELVLQLDVFQTYIYDVELGRCYVERGHIGIANENQFAGYGRNYLTVPEGLDIGGEYRVQMVRSHWIMSPTPFGSESDKLPGAIPGRYKGFDLLVISTIDLEADPGTIDAPILVTAKGGALHGTFHGAAIYIFTPNQFSAFMVKHQTKPWVTQGIISVTMIPKYTRYVPGFDYSDEIDMGAPALYEFPHSVNHTMQNNWRDSDEFEQALTPRYAHLKKFYTYPYMVIEFTTFNATPIVLKPESWNNAHAEVMERASMVPPGARVEFTPRWYNSKYSSVNQIADDLWPLYEGYEDEKGDDWGEYIDIVTQIANFPTMIIVNNGAIGYLASNTHGIAFSRGSADWTQQRALGLNQGQYDIATQAMHTAMDLSGIGVNADISQTANVNRTQAAQAVGETISGLIGGAAGGAAGGMGKGGALGAAVGAAGGVGGAIVGAVNTGIGIAANDEALAIRNLQAGDTVRAQNKQSGMVRDTNKGLADWAARGDYANQIAGINAKVQDAAMIQPTTSGQMAGETINISNGGMQVSARWKMLDPAAIRNVGEFWLRYGYSIRASIEMPKSLMVMTKFTYWKVSETYIRAATVPEGFKQVIRGIFEKGVTVWANPKDIGFIDWADNKPLPGIKY